MQTQFIRERRGHTQVIVGENERYSRLQQETVLLRANRPEWYKLYDGAPTQNEIMNMER